MRKQLLIDGNRIIVSEDGTIFHNGKELVNSLSTKGYYHVGICGKGKVKTYRVHRLVALAFIPNPNNLPYVNHIDGNKQNNNVSNLEWCTCKGNVQHAKKMGLIGWYKPVRCVNDGKCFVCEKDAINHYKLSHKYFRYCLNNNKTIKGLKFEYIQTTK